MGGISAKKTKRERVRGFFGAIRNWHLVLVLIPLAFLSATLLRFDHIRMTELLTEVHLADAVIGESDTAEPVDKTELDERLATALYNLKNFVSHHIVVNFIEDNGVQELHFGTGSFYLENQYNYKAAIALAEAEKKASEMSDDNPNGNVFAKAMEVCQPKAHQYGWDWDTPEYINCYYDVIYSFPAQDELTTSIVADIPDTALFRYDFLSPVWYPNLAGWLIVICVVLFIVILVRAIWWIILQIALRVIK
ncbi:MAG: hypothetical protein Q4E47_02115 [Candidatus Saccharibacteria bacterium]|nr:hypothetical protein [Candidatus Saccharibacteria bacterium]